MEKLSFFYFALPGGEKKHFHCRRRTERGQERYCSNYLSWTFPRLKETNAAFIHSSFMSFNLLSRVSSAELNGPSDKVRLEMGEKWVEVISVTKLGSGNCAEAKDFAFLCGREIKGELLGPFGTGDAGRMSLLKWKGGFWFNIVSFILRNSLQGEAKLFSIVWKRSLIFFNFQVGQAAKLFRYLYGQTA